jgi:hypothetical protein
MVHRKKAHRTNLYCAVSILLILAVVELWGSYQLLRHGYWARIIKVKSIQSITVPQPKIHDYYKKRIAKESWVQLQDPEHQCLAALKWTMNQARRIAPNSNSDDPVSLLKSVESGQGVLCDDMSILYQNVLAALGRPSRKIWLFRNVFDTYDTHSTVEVLLNGKWVIMCPTFGVTFKSSNGRLLSAQNVKEYLSKGRTSEIKTVLNGQTAYPARIEKYYINPFLLYNNVFVVEKSSHLFAKLPLFCYGFGSKLYYEKLPHESDSHLRFIQHLYFIFAVLIPVLILIVINYLTYLMVIKKQSRTLL